MKTSSETRPPEILLFSLLPPFTDRVMLTELLNASDLSSLPHHNDMTYNHLIACLKSDKDQIRRSARIHIASSLIKNKSNRFVSHVKTFLFPQTTESPASFIDLVDTIDSLDDEEDFSLCCRMIAAFPILQLDIAVELPRLGDLAKKRLPQLFSAFHDLSKLHIEEDFQTYSNDDWKFFCQIISSLPKLSELSMEYEHDIVKGMDDVKEWEILGEAFATLPCLSKLSLICVNFLDTTEVRWTAFCQALSKTTQLVSLSISGIDGVDLLEITDEFNPWEIFFNTVSLLPQLESLSLYACNLDQVRTTDWQHLSKFSQLSTLKLESNSLGSDPEQWNALCDALKSLSRLTSLDLSQNNLGDVSDEGWEVFAPILVYLQHLSLDWIQTSDLVEPKGLSLLLLQGIQTSKLLSLNLGDDSSPPMNWDEASFDLFCQMIVGAKYLSYLNLSNHFLRDISVERFEKLCNASLAASHLSTLNISNNRLPKDGWPLFWTCFNKSTHIHKLVLDMPDSSEWNVFSEGLTQARHLSSLSLFCRLPILRNRLLDCEEIVWNALKPLYNLVKFESNQFKSNPRIVELLKRNNRLSQFKANVKKLTMQLNSDKQKTDKLKHNIQAAMKFFSNFQKTLPDHPNSEICREEIELLLNDFYFACARWCAQNSQPNTAIQFYTLITLGSVHFRKARGNAFTIAYQGYRSDGDTAAQAFSKALPLCWEANRFISLDAEFQRTFDGFLLEAIGLTKTLELIPKVTSELRLKMFKYLSLLVLKEELQHIKSTDKTDFFQKTQISQGLVDMLAGCKLLSAFEEFVALDVDALWSSAKLKYDMARVPGEFEFYKLLCGVVMQLGEAPAVAVASQKVSI